jgi:hypothetical protein
MYPANPLGSVGAHHPCRPRHLWVEHRIRSNMRRVLATHCECAVNKKEAYMNRWTWLAASAGVFTLGVAAGRSQRLGLSSILGVFGVDTDVARLQTVTEALGAIIVPDPGTGSSDLQIEGVNVPGLVGGTIAVLFYRAVARGNGTFHVRVQSANGTTQPTEHTIPAFDGGALSCQEVLPAGLLTAENNSLIFAVSSDTGGGSVTFSEVAILYKSNQLTVPRQPVLTQG